MNINELDTYNLADAVKFHRRLNPRLWGRDEHLLPDVRQQLLAIAADFQEFLGVPDLDVKDITVSGSNAAYSYTKNSDIDLHLVVNMPADPVYQELFSAKKYQYNDQHNIRIGGADVELYVQTADQAHHSQGIYSVKNDQWISVPERKRAQIDHACVRDKVADLDARIHTAVRSGDAERIAALADKIKAMRQAGLEKHGEFGCENLAFKMLRNSGCIKLLWDARQAAQDRALSLREAPRKKFRYGFSEGHQGQPYSSDDGVAASTKMFVSEDDDTETRVHEFIQHVVSELGIDPVPHIRLHSDPEWSTHNHSFGRYDPDTHTLNVSMPNRHILDVLRTVAHELVHCSQHQQHGDMPDDAGETGSRWENDANARAGIIMRDWANTHPEDFEQAPLEEGASGYIPKNKKEAARPQYAMALSVDVHPGQTGTEANKLALKTGRNGEPGLLMRTANLRESLDQPYKMKWEKSGYGDMDALVKLPDGTYLSIMFNDEGNGEYQVEFHRDNSQAVTGAGDAQRVFATVLAAIQKFIKKYQPWRLTFSASKDPFDAQNIESRAKLYNRMVQRYARAWGYEDYAEDHGDQVTYELTQLKPGVAEDFDVSQLQISSEPNTKGGHYIEARIGNQEVGRVWFNPRKQGYIASMAWVSPNHRRQGIARRMYQYARDTLGLDIIPSPHQSADAQAFWASKPVEENLTEGLTISYVKESGDDYRIHNTEKLDRVLTRCCEMIERGQQTDPEKYGMVAACVIDPDNRHVYGINLPGADGTRRHAERVAIDRYRRQHGDVPQGSIVVTTLSPCNAPMAERAGDSCKDLLNSMGIHKVYCGYIDPTQHDDDDVDFTVGLTQNDDLWEACKAFADTFLHEGKFVTELFQSGKQNWQWRFRGSEEAAASFGVGDREYLWQALRHSTSKAWEIQFRLIRDFDRDPDDLDLFGTTGTGNSAEVLSTAVDITRAFLQEYGLDQVEELTFNAKEDSRIGLYAKMIKRLLPDWDLYSRKTEHYGMEFYLTDRRAYDKPENKITEAQLSVDVPNEQWLQDKQEYAQSKKRNAYGVPYMGTTTAYTTKDFRVPVAILKTLPGMRGEQSRVRQDDLQAIMQIMQDTGQLPLGRDGTEYAPFVNVAYNGEAWVNDGNHRIMAADRLGWKDLPVQISYFDGGERVESGAMWPGRIGLNQVQENFADGRNPGRKGDSKRYGIPKHATLMQLDKIGHGSGRKAQLARWQANMRRGRAK